MHIKNILMLFLAIGISSCHAMEKKEKQNSIGAIIPKIKHLLLQNKHSTFEQLLTDKDLTPENELKKDDLNTIIKTIKDEQIEIQPTNGCNVRKWGTIASGVVALGAGVYTLLDWDNRKNTGIATTLSGIACSGFALSWIKQLQDNATIESENKHKQLDQQKIITKIVEMESNEKLSTIQNNTVHNKTEITTVPTCQNCENYKLQHDKLIIEEEKNKIETEKNDQNDNEKELELWSSEYKNLTLKYQELEKKHKEQTIECNRYKNNYDPLKEENDDLKKETKNAHQMLQDLKNGTSIIKNGEIVQVEKKKENNIIKNISGSLANIFKD